MKRRYELYQQNKQKHLLKDGLHDEKWAKKQIL